MRWLLLCLVMIAGVLMGCSFEPIPNYMKFPEAVSAYILERGNPEVYPGIETVLKWDSGPGSFYIVMIYDEFDGWRVIAAFGMSNSKVPDQMTALYYQAARKKEKEREQEKEGQEAWRGW